MDIGLSDTVTTRYTLAISLDSSELLLVILLGRSFSFDSIHLRGGAVQGKTIRH